LPPLLLAPRRSGFAIMCWRCWHCWRCR